MDDLETVGTDAPEDTGLPSTEEIQNSENTDISYDSDKELTDEELKEEITRLQEEVKTEEDAKEKRHKEQDIGWKLKIIKEREKAKELEAKNNETNAMLKTYEDSLVEEAYTKAIDNNFGLPYFENLAKTNPKLADRIAQEKFSSKNAKTLILDTKKGFADNGDEAARKTVDEEEIRQAERDKIYEEFALEEAQKLVDELEGDEHESAVTYFEDITEGKKLTPTSAKKYAEMAIFYATRNRKPEEVKKAPVDKEAILASKANTGISNKSGGEQETNVNVQDTRQQLLNAGIPLHKVNLLYPLN